MNKPRSACFKFASKPIALAIAAVSVFCISGGAQAACPLVYSPILMMLVPSAICGQVENDAFLRANPAPKTLLQSQITTLSDVAKGRSGGLSGVARASLTNQTGLAGAAADQRWSGWAALSSNSIGYSFAPLNSSGNASSALIGVDYLYASGVLAGVALGTDSSKTDTSFNNGNVSTSGYTLSPYFMVPLSTNWTLDGSLGFGSGKVNSNFGGGLVGNTTDARSFGALALTYSTAMGNWQVQGAGSILASASKISQFTLSNAAVIAGSTNSVTQLRGGARAYYGAGQFVPFVGLTYSHDLSRTDVLPVAGQTPANARGAFIALAGVGINQGKQVSGSVQLTSEMRQQVRNNGVQGSLSLKF